jgi:hypothetical protein
MATNHHHFDMHCGSDDDAFQQLSLCEQEAQLRADLAALRRRIASLPLGEQAQYRTMLDNCDAMEMRLDMATMTVS